MKTVLPVLCALGLALPALTPAPASSAEPLIGEPAPAFELPSLGGDEVALADFRGKLVVLHFGAGW